MTLLVDGHKQTVPTSAHLLALVIFLFRSHHEQRHARPANEGYAGRVWCTEKIADSQKGFLFDCPRRHYILPSVDGCLKMHRG
jgi:hypothetical protein